MKIYEVVPDVNHYQSFHFDYPDDHPFWKSDQWEFDCTPKGSTWTPSVVILHPKLKRGNVFDLGPGALVFDAYATEALRDLLEMSGELLQLGYKGEQFTVLNPTECIDVLDDEKTEWVYGKSSGQKVRIKQHVFLPHRLTETPLFKIPETCKADILTVEGLKDPEDEFKFNVEKKGLKGLIFHEIWSDGK